MSIRSFVILTASSRVCGSWLCKSTCRFSSAFARSAVPLPERLTVAPVISRMCFTFWPFWPTNLVLRLKLGSGSSMSIKILCVNIFCCLAGPVFPPFPFGLWLSPWCSPPDLYHEADPFFEFALFQSHSFSSEPLLLLVLPLVLCQFH